MTEDTKAEKLHHDPKLAIVGKIESEAAITWLVTENPRSPSKVTFQRFAKYFGSATVGDYLAAGGTKGDLLWDIRAGYLTVAGVTTGPAGDKPPRAPRAKKEKAAAVASEDAQAAVATETIE